MPRRNSNGNRYPGPRTFHAQVSRVLAEEKTEALVESIGPRTKEKYLAACLGRALVGQSLTGFVQSLYKLSQASNLNPNLWDGTGVVYISGQDLVRRTNYGLQADGLRLSPRETITREISRLAQTDAITVDEAIKPLTVPTHYLSSKKWGKSRTRIQLNVGDYPSESYPQGAIMRGEKAATRQALGLQATARAVEIGGISHAITIADVSADPDQVQSLLRSLKPSLPDQVSLAPMGLVEVHLAPARS